MKDSIIAIAFFNHEKIKGTIYFHENPKDKNIKISVNLSGFIPNSIHGIHIHEAGDLQDNCMSACAHFNPYHKNHGGKDSKERHIGDLGNIRANKNGIVNDTFYDHLIKLRGNKCNIIGRSVVIHENEDDCGKTNHPDSLTTGNSGKRIACAVIGYSKLMF